MDGKSPHTLPKVLNRAAYKGNLHIISHFAETDPDFMEYINDCLYAASQAGEVEVVWFVTQ